MLLHELVIIFSSLDEALFEHLLFIEGQVNKDSCQPSISLIFQNSLHLFQYIPFNFNILFTILVFFVELLLDFLVKFNFCVYFFIWETFFFFNHQLSHFKHGVDSEVAWLAEVSVSCVLDWSLAGKKSELVTEFQLFKNFHQTSCKCSWRVLHCGFKEHCRGISLKIVENHTYSTIWGENSWHHPWLHTLATACLGEKSALNCAWIHQEEGHNHQKKYL